MTQYPSRFVIDALNGLNGFRLNGPEDNDAYSGSSVNSAGDVNGDGFGDLIIGAYGATTNPADSTTWDAGASFVVFGKAGGFDAAIPLASLDGGNGFRLNGVAAYDHSGYASASAGDVNGDGLADVIIGAGQADTGGLDSGASYVVFGRTSGFSASLDLASLDGVQGFRLDGAAADDLSGFAVASAGDVNGDGYADVIIGADGADPNGASSGSSYVVFGKASGFTPALNLGALNGLTGFRLDGRAAGERAGSSVASAGDVNGDGFDDVIIGAPGASTNGVDAGASYVVFGKASGFPATIDLSTLNGVTGFRMDGIRRGDRLGVSVASAGDVNGDGYADLIVGARGAFTGSVQFLNAGANYVVFGKAAGFSPVLNLASLDGSNGTRLDGPAGSINSGVSVSSIGDFNGDGFDDLAVGAPYADDLATGNGDAGAVYVMFGQASGFGAAKYLSFYEDGTKGFKINGAKAGDQIGFAVSTAGDVNGDGIGDLILGAEGHDSYGANSNGASYVIFGSRPAEAVNRVGTFNNDRIVGSDANDVLGGGKGHDTISGFAGNDVLIGDGPLSLTAAAQSIRRLYIATLDRGPDDGGWTNWTTQRDGGQSLDAIAAGFVGSTEFQTKYGTLDNTQFVTQLYRNVLDREPDAAGLANAVNALNSGALSRTSIVTGFSESAEFVAGTSTTLHAGQVYRLYGATLARAPDAGGFETWTDGLGVGRALIEIAAGFVNSSEFQTKYGNQDNTGFVTLLYQNVLGRAPDSGGLAFWTGQLDGNAQSRTQVVTGFSESAEYVNATRAAADGFVRNVMTAWSDTLIGGAGDDRLTGGRGSDRFAFVKSDGGNDTIYGFESFDTLQLTGFGFANSAAALAAITQQGANAVLTFNGGSITFDNTQLSVLQGLSAQGWVLG